jgi:hypothetical protein
MNLAWHWASCKYEINGQKLKSTTNVINNMIMMYIIYNIYISVNTTLHMLALSKSLRSQPSLKPGRLFKDNASIVIS